MHQIKMRAERIGTFEEEMLLYCETDLDAITNVVIFKDETRICGD